MKTHIIFRIFLAPFKLLLLIPIVLFITIPCSLINEEELGDRILDWFQEVGNFKKELK